MSRLLTSPARIKLAALLPPPPPPVRTSRLFRSSASAAAAMQPRFSAGVDEAAVRPALEPLLLPSRWALANDGAALERAFRFKTFAKTWVRAVL